MLSSRPIQVFVTMSEENVKIPENVKYIRFEMADLNGVARSKTVPTRHAHPDSPYSVFMFSGSSSMGPRSKITLPAEIVAAGCPNTPLIPDWRTFKTLPYASTSDTCQTGRVICSQAWLDGSPMTSHCRVVCENQIEKLKKELGFSFLSACEYEFSLCKFDPSGKLDSFGNQCILPAFNGVDLFATLQNSKSQIFCEQLEREILNVGIDIESMNCEYGEGQLEITFHPSWDIDSADNSFTFKTAVKEIAQKRGMRATFMCKPFSEGACNGGHFNFSLWEDDGSITSSSSTDNSLTLNPPNRPVLMPYVSQKALEATYSTKNYRKRNVFADADSPDGLSEVGKWWIGGVLAHSSALQALAAPTISCYNRVKSWSWAPTRKYYVVIIAIHHSCSCFVHQHWLCGLMCFALFNCCRREGMGNRQSFMRDQGEGTASLTFAEQNRPSHAHIHGVAPTLGYLESVPSHRWHYSCW